MELLNTDVICETVAGIVIVERDGQLLSILFSSITFEGMLTVFNAPHPSNAPEPISVMLSGRITSSTFCWLSPLKPPSLTATTV